jgi:DNA polymerase
VPIKNGTHAYAEKAEVLLWAYAGGEGEPRVWDVINGTDNYVDELSGLWVEQDICNLDMPPQLEAMIDDDETLVWFQNGGMFDFVVLAAKMQRVLNRIPMRRWRDTMVQAFAHSLPGALDKLGEILQLHDDDRKLKDEGRKYIRLFCIPKDDGTYNDKASHPVEWAGFIRYAARDITTMRAAHWKMPKWNYKTGKQVDMWHRSLRMNSRGMLIDRELATKMIAAADKAKNRMAKRVQDVTDQEVQSATQRDALLAFILGMHGVELPDMKADTLERRMEDPDLPAEVKELLGIRLRASMNSTSKCKTALKGMNVDDRLRGCSQYRGAGRTGRTAHRLFQPGNLPRPAYKYPYIEAGIAAIKADALDLVVENEMEMCASALRGLIIAPPGRKLAVADLAAIEGRVIAWLAGEEWKLQAFRDYDTILGEDENGKLIRKGPDLYVRAYMTAFNVSKLSDDEHEAFLQRQIGKVMELMLAYAGGVGAFITGAATYGIDLKAMTEAVYDTLPADVVAEAADFLQWQYESVHTKLAKVKTTVTKDGNATTVDQRMRVDPEVLDAAKAKVRFNLSEKVFITCDALKRLWRAAHPRISSYWKELEETVNEAIDHPGVTFTARKVKVRRDGNWLRLGLPSGRALCYPSIHRTKSGDIAYTGQNTYSRTWQDVKTYGGKLAENLTQAVANDQFEECKAHAEDAGYDLVLDVHDELVTEVDEDSELTADYLGELMCSDLGWNEGLPLAAAGDEMTRYHKT